MFKPMKLASKRGASFIAGLALLMASVTGAVAAPLTGSYTLGGATTGSGPWTMTSTDSTYSVLRFVLDTPVDFGALTDLNVSYDSILGGIGGGTPRIAIVTDANHDSVEDGSFLIHFGPAGSFVDTSLGTGFNSGNLLALTDWGRYDLTDIGGSAYTDRAAALALASTYSVLRVSLIVDSYGGNNREFVIDSIKVSASAVPEPGTLLLLGFGLIGLSGFATRRKK
jgi:hypothetical protein